MFRIILSLIVMCCFGSCASDSVSYALWSVMSLNIVVIPLLVGLIVLTFNNSGKKLTDEEGEKISVWLGGVFYFTVSTSILFSAWCMLPSACLLFSDIPMKAWVMFGCGLGILFMVKPTK